MHNTDAVNEWLKEYQSVDKDLRQLTVKASTMGTGFNFLHKDTHEFEWNSKSIRNKISGLYSR